MLHQVLVLRLQGAAATLLPEHILLLLVGLIIQQVPFILLLLAVQAIQQVALILLLLAVVKHWQTAQILLLSAVLMAQQDQLLEVLLRLQVIAQSLVQVVERKQLLFCLGVKLQMQLQQY